MARRVILRQLRRMGVGAGLAIKPRTPAKALIPYLEEIDLALVMTVEPGFGGQSFIQEAAEKIKPVRQLVGPNIRIEVDGGIDPKTTPIVTALGADTLVAGNAIFSKPDRAKAINDIRNACVK